MWKKQRLLFRLMLVILVNIIVTIFILYLLLSRQIIRNTQNNEEEFLLSMGEHLAEQELVIDALETEEANPELQKYTQSVGEAFNYDYVVIMTPDSIRLTHPDPELVYERFQGGDQYRVFEGESYVSIGQGTLGQSLRSFVPVYNEDSLVGAVSIGLTTQNIEELARQGTQTLSISFIISTVIGMGIAGFVAYSLKKQMLDMEPVEIARVLEERNAMMEYTTDASFATSVNNKILLFNREAEINFNLEKEQEYSIRNVLPFINERQFTIDKPNREEIIYQYEGKDYIVSVVPIIVRSKLVGRLFTLRDATEMHTLTNQLYSTSEYAQALESQNHDFLNKLHVIYGLTDLEEYEELKQYLQQLIEPEQEFSSRVAHLVHNPVIGGFLIGERRKFSENQNPLSIEIYPDIPSTSNLENTQSWIQFVTQLHKILLNTSGELDIYLKLGYYDGKLRTKYHINGNIQPVKNWITHSIYQDTVTEMTDKHAVIEIAHHYKTGA